MPRRHRRGGCLARPRLLLRLALIALGAALGPAPAASAAIDLCGWRLELTPSGAARARERAHARDERQVLIASHLGRLPSLLFPPERIELHYLPATTADDANLGAALRDWTDFAIAHPADLARVTARRPGFARATRVDATEPSLGAPRARNFAITLALGPGALVGEPGSAPVALVTFPARGHLLRRERVDSQRALDLVGPTRHFRAYAHVFRHWVFELDDPTALAGEVTRELSARFARPHAGVRIGQTRARGTGHRPTDDLGLYLGVEGVDDPVTELAMMVHVFERMVTSDLLDRHGRTHERLPRGPWLGAPAAR